MRPIPPLRAEAAAIGTWHLLPVRANRIAEITTFDARLFPTSGLEPVLGTVP